MADGDPAAVFTELLRRDGSIAEFAIQSLITACSTIHAAVSVVEGEERVLSATRGAIRELDWQGSSTPDGVLFEVQCDGRLTNAELEASVDAIRGALGGELDVLVGSFLNVKIGGAVRVTLVATGGRRAGSLTANG